MVDEWTWQSWNQDNLILSDISSHVLTICHCHHHIVIQCHGICKGFHTALLLMTKTSSTDRWKDRNTHRHTYVATLYSSLYIFFRLSSLSLLFLFPSLSFSFVFFCVCNAMYATGNKISATQMTTHRLYQITPSLTYHISHVLWLHAGSSPSISQVTSSHYVTVFLVV